MIGLAEQPDGSGTFEPLADFTSNADGAQVVNALGPIREIVQAQDQLERRYLAIRTGPVPSQKLSSKSRRTEIVAPPNPVVH